MQDSWKLSNTRLLEWLGYLEEDYYALIDDLEYVLSEMKSGSYPKDVNHLLEGKNLHKRAVKVIEIVLKTKKAVGFDLPIYDDVFPWIITKEKVEELITLLKMEKLDEVRTFFDSLNYLKYIQAWEAGFLALDEKVMKKMLESHENMMNHMNKAIKNRRIRVLF